MTNHFKNVCKHGEVLGQCRCPAPDKSVRTVECPVSHAEKYAEEGNVSETKEKISLEWTLASVLSAASMTVEWFETAEKSDDPYQRGRTEGYVSAMADIIDAVRRFEEARAERNSST